VSSLHLSELKDGLSWLVLERVCFERT
jgi:hypothetical protein